MIPTDSAAAAGRRARRVTTALGLVAPLLLVLVGMGQMGLVRHADLTPWKGGGFGMFAAIDERVLVVEVDVGDERRPVSRDAVATVVDPAVIDRAVAMPDSSALERVGAAVLSVPWQASTVDGPPVGSGGLAVPARDGKTPTAVHIALEEVRYDAGAHTATRERLASLTVRR